LQGDGEAYGVEFLAKKDEGKLTGWIGYTLSWSTRQFDELNNGKRFFAKYDRRHNLSIVMTYKLSERIHFGAVWVFANGSRFTPQVGQYIVPNPSLTGLDRVPIYSDRNAVSLSPNHRLDLNIVLKPRPNKKKRFKSEWSFSAYNVYNSNTPYTVDIVLLDDPSRFAYREQGLFGFLPSIAYNFSF